MKRKHSQNEQHIESVGRTVRDIRSYMTVRQAGLVRKQRKRRASNVARVARGRRHVESDGVACSDDVTNSTTTSSSMHAVAVAYQLLMSSAVPPFDG